MRVLLVWPFYQEYVRAFYAARPGLATRAHAEQLRAVLSDYFGWPPAVCLRLAERGHDVEICLSNVAELGRQWCREAGVPFDPATWPHEGPLEVARRFAPDVVWLGTSVTHFGDWLSRLKRIVPRVVAWIAAPLPGSTRLSGVDAVLTSHANFVQRFRAAGLRAERLLPAFDPGILAAQAPPERDVPVSFVGSLSAEHAQRVRFLRTLASETPLQLWAARPRVLSRSLLRPRSWSGHVQALALASRTRGQVYGAEMYDVLRRSQLTVNVHIGAAGGLAGNMRMFEATGCGAVLLTEAAPNLRELFVPGEEVAPYEGERDLVEQIRRLLSAPSDAAEMGRRGQAATLARHTTARRAAELEQLLVDVCAS